MCASAKPGSQKQKASPDAEEDAPRMCIVPLNRGSVQSSFAIGDKDLLVGRDDECDIVLQDRRASKIHAKITRQGGRLIVQDMNSSNGTYVNEHKVVAQRLRPGDLVRIGRCVMLCLSDPMPERETVAGKKGWLSVKAPGQAWTAVPLSSRPLLIGNARDAHVPLADEVGTDYRAHVMAVAGGVQMLDLKSERPRCALLRDGEHISVGPIELVYRLTKEKPEPPSTAPDETAGPTPDDLQESRFVEPVDDEDAIEGSAPHLVTDLSALAAQGQLGESLQEEADYADLAPPAAGAAPAPRLSRPGVICILTATSGPCDGQEFEVGGKRVVIGRSPKCDICLKDDGISREHASVERYEGDVVIQDLNSSNGVFVNGKRIRRHPLRPGNVVRIGSTEFLVHL